MLEIPQNGASQPDALKLSDYVRAGAQQTRKAEKYYVDYDWEYVDYDWKKALCTCAFGAAYFAWNNHSIDSYTNDTDIEKMLMNLEIDPHQQVTHPLIERKMDIMDMIFELNDVKHLSREEIATWLQSIGL